MNAPPDEHPEDRGTPLASWLLAVVTTAAALAVLPARDGSAVLTLYREPKAVAFLVLVWAWLAVLLLGKPGRAVLAALPRAATHWSVLPWLAWVAYMAISSTRGLVSANAIYELRTLLPATLWLVVLVAWRRVDPRADPAIRRALIVAMALVSAIGAWQLVRPIGWLPPIHPELGGPHPSTFGFKNPAALAVLGQWFVVLHWALIERRPAWKATAIVLCLGEALYIASLHSRTALLALVCGLVVLGGVVLGGVGLVSRRARPMPRALLAAALGGLATLLVVVALVAPWRERAWLGVEMLIDPSAYLESDRGTYLRNTLAMVDRHPFGVGLGDWQTAYPVFRAHDRGFAFDNLVEVRRAHSDHVQILGEGGWPGLGLWVLALGTTIVGAIRRWHASGDLQDLLVGTQLVAWTVAMATDYVIEMPFHRFQLMLVVALALPTRWNRPEPSTDDPAARPPHRMLAIGLACLLGLVAATEAWRGALLLSRLRASAFMGQLYQRGLSTGDPGTLGRALQLGEVVARRPGYTKTTPQDERILAHLYWLHGARPQAHFWLRQSLECQPYSPAGLELASHLLEHEAPDAAAAFGHARDHVLFQAEHGFEGPYPTWPD